MFFVTDNFTMQNASIYIPTLPFTQYSLTNVSTEPAVIHHSDDLVNWQVLTRVNSQQSVDVEFTKRFIKCADKQSIVYAKSKLNTNFYHPQNSPNTNSSTDNSGLLAKFQTLEEDVNYRLMQVESSLGSVNYGLSDVSNMFQRLYENLDTKIHKLSLKDVVDRTSIKDRNAVIKQLNLASKTDLAIKALETGVINTLSPASSGEGNSRQWDVTFSKPFESVPVITISATTSHTRLHYVRNVSKTGFTYSTNYVDYDSNIHWVAFTV